MIKRFVTAFLLLSVAFYVIPKGGLPLYLFVSLVSLASIYELLFMSGLIQKKRYVYFGMLLVAIFFLSLLPIAMNMPGMSGVVLKAWTQWPVKIVVIFVIGLGLVEVFMNRFWLIKNQWFILFRFVLFVVCTFPFIYLIREGQNGFVNMLFCCLMIWTVDTTALFGGKFFGRHKLSIISPKKTIEGAVVAVICTLLMAGAFIAFFKLDYSTYLLIAFAISILAQLGDLHESLTKRYFNVKDSSGLLPGHGGFYDRADSSLFVMPIIFFIFN